MLKRNLLFVMTPGVNLSTWKDNGSFNREIRPYLTYAGRGAKVRIISFGRERYDFTKLHENIEVIAVRHSFLLNHFLPFLKISLFKWADVIKTNQSYFSWILVFAAKIASRPIVLRSGYVYGEYLESVDGLTLSTKIYQVFEGWAFRNATSCVVTTKTLSMWVIAKYRLKSEKVVIIPNFVDTDIFRPINAAKVPNSVVSVGRLTSVKRYDMLIRACGYVPKVKLTIIGEGEERASLASLAKSLGVELQLPGTVSNNILPELLCQHQVFALTSKREGHPKALIEAMACGLPCVTSFMGQENFGDTVISTKSDVESVASQLNQLLGDAQELRAYSAKACRFAVSNYSFRQVFSIEEQLLVSIAHA